jgi:hypothetical protein
MMEAAPSSETSVLTRFTRRKIPVGGILEHLRQFSFLVVGCCTSNRIVVLNVRAPIRDKTGDVNDSFYGELERVFDTIKISFGIFQCQRREERYFQTIK